jgi:2-isopropylmalate synthase
MARVGLRHSDGRLLSQEASGDGPVDAAFKAIEAATGTPVTLRKFEVRSVSMGEDAQGEAVVTVEHNGRSYRGSSVTTDIVESGVRAFLEVVNRIESTRATSARMEKRASEAEEAASTI